MDGVKLSRFGTRTSLRLEIAIFLTVAIAGTATVGTLIPLSAGTTRLVDPGIAALMWIVCAAVAGVGVAMRHRVPAETIVRHKRPLALVLGAALAWIVLGMARRTFDAGDGLVGEYFTNVAWTGSPAFSVIDTEPSAARMRQRWNGVQPEQFSVRWTGFLTVGQPGLYTFVTTSDDGSQLIVDNQLVVENGGMHSLATRSGRIQLDRGSHVVVLRYVQFGAASALAWSWSRDGAADEPVPGWALSLRPTRPATVVNARLVDWVIRSLAIVVALTTLWHLRASLRGREQAVGRWLDARRRDAITPYRNTASLVFSVSIVIVTLVLPWPDGAYQLSFRAVESTARHLNTSAMKVLGSFGAFQADINSPHSGEYVLPRRVQEMLAMLRAHAVEQYRVSDLIAGDAWGYQQIVASAWPSKLEKAAKAGFVLNQEPITAGCTLIEKQSEVSLVDCP